jgi:hypothetical protein
LLAPDTRHLPVLRSPKGEGGKPFLLKKKIDKSDPYFVNYLRDATLNVEANIYYIPILDNIFLAFQSHESLFADLLFRSIGHQVVV